MPAASAMWSVGIYKMMENAYKATQVAAFVPLVSGLY